MLDKKKGKLTIFFGYDNTLLSTMIFQGIKKNDEGYKVYIGCLDTKNNPSVLKYVYKLQSQINVCVDLNQIYEKKPDIVIIENLNLNINQQFKRCEEITSLLPALLVFNLPFTFVKAMVSVVVTLFIYKPLSPIIKGNYK